MIETEENLMVRVQGGDQVAYQQLVNLHLAPLSHFVGRMLTTKADCEDIIQEVFYRLWQKADQYQPRKAKLTTWLHHIAHNLCIDLLRKQMPAQLTEQSMKSEFTLGDGPNVDIAQSGEYVTTDDAEQVLLKARKSEAVKQALQNLSERHRSAIIMSHYQGLSNKQVAEILEISVHALESVLSRARKQLKTFLQSDQNVAGSS